MKPLVGISCCSKSFGPNGLPNHAASDFCVRAVSEICGAVPVLLPALGERADIAALLSRLDGILLTGSRSHVAPGRYGAQWQADEDCWEDPARDATTLPLIRAATEHHVPILAICRGLQEMNVALGGTLHQCLRLLPGKMNHACALPEDKIGRVAAAHSVMLTKGGLLHHLAGRTEIGVNSLHQQGIERVAPGLIVEAMAEDGTVEAVRSGNGGFALGVQWHPEFDTDVNGFSHSIFAMFAESLREIRGGNRLAAD